MCIFAFGRIILRTFHISNALKTSTNQTGWDGLSVIHSHMTKLVQPSLAEDSKHLLSHGSVGQESGSRFLGVFWLRVSHQPLIRPVSAAIVSQLRWGRGGVRFMQGWVWVQEREVCGIHCLAKVHCGWGRELASGSCFWMVSSFPALLVESRLPPLNECLIWSLLTPFARVFSLNIFWV